MLGHVCITDSIQEILISPISISLWETLNVHLGKCVLQLDP